MCNILLACDLDNTLLHSYKRRAKDDVCIEKIEGKAQGYMSLNTYSLIPELSEKILLVPVTSRSVSQYLRIQWPHHSEPRFAVTTNGAILLDNREYEKAWLTQSKQFAAQYKNEFDKMDVMLSEMQKVIRYRMTDKMNYFALCNDESDANAVASEIKEYTVLDVVQTGRKIYLLIPEMNKGTATEKLKTFFRPQKLICAGDSVIDVPMLNKADIAIVPNAGLACYITAPKILLCPDDMNYSNYVLVSALAASK